MWHIPSYMNQGEYHLFSNFEIWKFQIDKIKHSGGDESLSSIPEK